MKHKKRIMKGDGIFDNINNFLKSSKLISSIGSVALPALGGLASGIFTANPIVAGVGTAAGSSLNEYIKSQGYGRKRGGAVYVKGQVPLHKMSGAGIKRSHHGGNSVFNNVQSSYGKIKIM
jgi:hypothetical protein